ncbi:bifunctional [glutamate--ammonia ligase]-adenylyl-L-tyrosine phosphorylase/[glutamate--ammonia-ligase] adenylyltransferase [Noviherbaspirillum pedocola]|uniref:Bifunctional glutamine synthetase adenylyltransferase/adenylyl-removing enzyme n=1 Tax=Noviherbaspirillum pedocola TaxID=2801341 RepID=A0A934W4X4_9BURK|nr:bifunctional [glutamate--ammonia ligase]-adenylyl-L-tyrosine phosphorylase/[glutamate--ammonia-ligase] adenylyltransferase [Noviherbaspirillum pedocola]MBK4733285.1 bifunctional [glutamate--ammonia ligase]-adenylyl-L-tyrosine phosphorylase/[glutamate--ammonia-ligase] adenylyltransferase [Noviherbaspirillum pedocola]
MNNISPSRFLTRWLQGDERRVEQLDAWSQSSLSYIDFAEMLRAERDAGMPLPRAMRRVRNLVVCALITRDLDGRADLDEVVTTISRFADFSVQTLLTALDEEMRAQHGEPIGEESGRPQRMIVLGMGKLGGFELNVSSDIDLIFVYPENGETAAGAGQRQLSNVEYFTRLGKRLIGAISEVAEDGYVFRVDMALRPNGASGPLVASLGMVEEYLVVQGREWERYAWVKARALTGEAEDIAALDAIVRPFVYRRYLDYSAIDALRNMHAQIRAEVRRQEARHPERNQNVKLGRGGIREIEFLAQVFQLIRGGRDAELRERSTRRTLTILAQKDLLGADEVAELQAAYVFLRNLEHRLQYLDDAQTHILPANEDDRLIIARMAGFPDTPALLAELDRQRGIVAAQFDAMFSDKSEEAPDGASEEAANIAAVLSDPENEAAIAAHLGSLGFTEAAAAARRIVGTWTSPRLASMPENSRNLLAALMAKSVGIIAANAQDSLATLARLLDFFEAIARRASYLALLTEYPQALERVIRMMAASGWAASYLTQHPLLLDELLDDRSLRTAPDWVAFAAECRRELEAVPGDTERQMDVLRELHHAQLLRLLAQDLEGELTVERLADHLSSLADVLVGATLEAAWQTVRTRHRDTPQFAVIAYGKLGGKELGYASDLDVVFVYDDDDQEAPGNYAKLAQRFITWMTMHTPAGILFDIDIALRPDGASGLMVTSIAAFEKYQLSSAWVWEHQALTRARFCAGHAPIGERFEALRERVLRLPRDPAKLKTEILTMRAKMHEAHPNRSPLFDLKHDSGGMIDIEFIVQFLVLRHAQVHAELTADIGNIALLKLCGQLGLIDAPLAQRVADAYRSFRKLQHGIRLQGEERARVAPERVKDERAAVEMLWALVFG